ncbi:type II secretion system protein, partial [candidate division KSB1 bacterium]|nr:type II secretion system protein [candidate division KSB1 bacterium]
VRGKRNKFVTRRHGTISRRLPLHGFTLIELLVVIAIISLLVSILLPSLNRAKNLAKSVMCLNNLKQIGCSFALYSVDDDGKFPPMRPYKKWTTWWDKQMISAELIVPELLKCPADDEERVIDDYLGHSPGWARSYGYNGYIGYVPEEELGLGVSGDILSLNSNPADLFLLVDRKTVTSLQVIGMSTGIDAFHDMNLSHTHSEEGANVVCADGHAETIYEYTGSYYDSTGTPERSEWNKRWSGKD